MQKKNGFTLIETLIAILILTTAIAGPLTIASRGLNAALIAKDQTTASYLAQDAVEYVRAARDTNRLVGGDWLTGSGGSGTVVNLGPCISQNCTVDSLDYKTPGTWAPTACGGTCPLYVLTTSGGTFFTQNSSGAKKSIFTRVVNITPEVTQGGQNDEAEVVVTVSWNDVSQQTHSLVVREDIFNWE